MTTLVSQFLNALASGLRLAGCEDQGPETGLVDDGELLSPEARPSVGIGDGRLLVLVQPSGGVTGIGNAQHRAEVGVDPPGQAVTFQDTDLVLDG